MADECLDLTSDTEIDLKASVPQQRGRPVVVSLLSDSEGDAKSPPKRLASTAGILRKQSAPRSNDIRNHDIRSNDVSTSSLQPKPNTSSAPLQYEARLASSQQTHPTCAALGASLPEDDEDADLHIPLAFAAKSKPTPSCSAYADSVPNVRAFDAAIGRSFANTSALVPQPTGSHQRLAHELEHDERGYSAMADLGSQLTSAPKPSKKRSRPANDDEPVDKEAAKEEKKARAAQDRERKKADAAQEKERKRLQRESDKMAKEAAKAMQKQEKLREKEDSRASKGAYALQEITAILDPKLAADKMGRDIMDKLQSYSKKAPTKCNGLKMDIQINPMSPTKSIMWRRSSVAESGADMSSSDFEDVPYVMLYFTPEDFVKEVEKDDFQSVFDRAAAAHPDCTLGLMVDKLETWLTQEERKNYRGNIRRTKTDLFVADLAVRWPGVRHMLALDQAQASAYVVSLTCALAMQPYKAQESWLYSYGGTKETTAMRELMNEKPLEHKERETWLNALVHVDSVAPAAAHGVASAYPSLSVLLAACMDPCKDQRAKQRLIEGLPQPGGRSKIGAMAAKKLIGLLTAEDPMTAMDSFAV